MRNLLMMILCGIFLSGCSGSIFGGAPDAVKDMENILTRPANKREDALLDRCLKHIFHRQKYAKMKHGRFISQERDLNYQSACDNKIDVRLHTNGAQYLVEAILVDGKEKVRYTLNDKGEVFEHNDMNFSETDSL